MKNVEDIYPLSPLQQGLLFHSLLAPESESYVNQLSCTLQGELDPGRFRRTWEMVVERHQILRSAFVWEGMEQPLQVVRQQVQLDWEEHDWRGLAETELAGKLDALRAGERRRPFALAKAPLMRMVLARHQDDAHEFVWTFHHLLLDGWSTPLLFQEIFAIYGALLSGGQPALPTARPYREYIAWLQRQDLAQAEAFWRRELAGFSAPTPLAIDRPDAGGQGFEEQQVRLRPEIATALQSLAAGNKLTLNTVLLGAWAVLLSRYSGERDVVLGSVVSGRPADLPGVESIVGLFINTLPVRVKLPAGEAVSPWLQALQTRLVELRQYEFSPLAQVQKWSEVPPGTPLFENLYVFENYPVGERQRDARGGSGPAFGLSNLRTVESTHYPLSLSVSVASGLSLRVTHDASRLEPGAVDRLLGHLTALLESVASRPDQRLSELRILSHQEVRQLEAWNETRIHYAADRCLHEWIEEQADRTPDAVALSFAGEELSYRELDRQANRLANYLRELGCGLETRVGVYMERSLEMVIALVAILKAGGAYMPLDPEHPAKRVAFQAENAQVPVVLTQERLLHRLPSLSARVVLLDAEPAQASAGDERPAHGATPDNAAYVLYTSGSTGMPKGVVISHRAIVNRLLWMQDAYRLTSEDRVLQKTPFSFDVSVWELFWPLMTGARLVVARPGGHRDSAYLARLIAEQGITVLHFVPSMLQLFLREPGLESCRSLREVMASGEALPADLVQRFFARLGARLHNLYGPTEAAVDVTAWECEPGPARTVPIGRPIANTGIHLLDPYFSPVPVGVPGELYIGGVNLARGYVHRPDLTAERFLPDPAAGRQREPGARLYRTGDLARYRQDGAIEFLGRTDHQVKVRGFRIELGEIETVVLAHPGVREAAVVVHERQDGHRRLVAYIVGTGGQPPGSEELRRFLLERLPEYMVPALFVPLPRLPLSANGKLERRGLPEPEAVRPDLAEAFAAPESPGEATLAEIWSEVLKVERVGRNDSFFALGGDSILSLQVLSKARERGIELSLQQVFQRPTLRELAAQAEHAGPAERLPRSAPFELLSDEDRSRLPEGLEDAYPLAQLQAGMLFHGELSTESSIYHNTVSVHLRAPFDLAKLDLALQRLAARHPLLRTSFSLTGFSEPLQLVHRSVRIPLEVYELRQRSSAEQEEELDRWFESETHRLFDWRQAPLLRFHVHRRAEDRFQLSWSEHHAILDGWSVAAMTAELGQDYLALIREGLETPAPAAPASQYRDFVALERQVLADGEARRFWLERLREGTVMTLPRLADRPPAEPSVVSLRVPLPPEVSTGTQAVAARAGVPLKNVLLAVHARVLGLVSGQDDLITGVVNNGRLEEADGERVFGLFLNTLPYRLHLDGGTWLDLARQSFESESAMLPFRRFPLAEIQRLAGGRPLFEVAFTYMNFHVMQGFASVSGNDMQDLGSRNNVPTNFTLSIYFQLDALSSHLSLTLDYDASQLTAGQMQAIAGYYQRALASLAERPESRYAEECLLSELERRQVVDEWNHTRVSYPGAERCLHELFEAQAASTPDAVAVVFEGEELSYRELNARTNRLARFLRRLGVGPEARVGVCLERSINLVAALYSILKAGGAYVPLDPGHPADRLAFTAADAGAPVVLTTRRWAGLLPAGARLVLLDEEAEDWAGEPGDDLPPLAGPDNLAYVIYTSGSTGTPKGAMNTHRAVVNRLLWMQDAYRLTASDRVLQKTPFSFDVSVWEFFWPLLAGARLVVARPDGHRQPDYLVELIAGEGVTTLHFVPPMLRAFLQEPGAGQCASLRQVFSSGEALPAELERRYFEIFPHAGLHNLYGPTEAAIDVTAWTCDRARPGQTVPIGRPIANLGIYLLDAALNPVPPGSPGELHIGGAGLARGYHARPDLTAERFVPDPWSTRPGARLYKTGDRSYQRPDGAIEYLGRLDHQVKLRGHRIELGEIESALRDLPAVRDAAVLLREDQPGDPRIVAYVVPDPDSDPEARENRELTELAGEQVAQWQMVFDRTYETSGGSDDLGFNIVGWNSSYTNQPLPALEMRDWVDSTVERILSLAPQEVLEIGCGTGLLLSRIAPSCRSYWATDFSAAALAEVRRLDLPDLRLLQQAADDFTDIPEASFDAVILNSVVQYFPSVNYLLRVIEGAARVVRDGGFLFLGDLRNLPLHHAFHSSVELYRTPASLPIEQVRRRTIARAAENSELVLHPEIFALIAHRLPRLSGVRVILKRGRHHNEITRFRYDVILRVGEAATAAAPLRLDWTGDGLDLKTLRHFLAEERPEELLLTRVPNSRVTRELLAAELLETLDRSATVGDLRDAVREAVEAAPPEVDPEDLWAMAGELGYAAELSWSTAGDAGHLDARLWRAGQPPRWREPLSSSGLEPDWNALANNPLLGRRLARLVPRLRDRLRQRLPEPMVPATFVLLPELPLSPSGKLDRRALPAPDQARPATTRAYVPPRTPTEARIAEIWEEILKLDRVGVHDNLIEIGGHSLLATQIAVRIREVFHITLPLRTLYSTPTLEGLALAVLQRQAEQTDADTLESLLARVEGLPESDLQGLMGALVEEGNATRD